MAFQDVKPGTFALPVWERKFVGFDNFIKAFTDRLFPQTMVNTIALSILGIAIGTLSAIIFALILNGALIDMTDLIEEYGPNIKKLYGDEFEKMIKDYLAAHPTADDGSENIGFSLSASDWHWMITLGNPSGAIAEGAPDNGEFLIDDKNNATYKYTSEKVREYFKWMNRMYNEGILDQDFATQTHEDYIAKVASGRVLSLFDPNWDYLDAEKLLKQDGKLDKTYCEIPLTLDESVKSCGRMYQGLKAGWGVGITTACENPEAAVKFLDFLCSDEGQVLTNWGIEDTNYLVDENGKRYRTQEEIDAAENDPNYKKETGVGFHNYPFPCYGPGIEDATGNPYSTTNKESTIAKYNDEQKAACKARWV